MLNTKLTHKETDSLTKINRVMSFLETRDTVAHQDIASYYGVKNPYVIMSVLLSLEVLSMIGVNCYAVNRYKGVTPNQILSLMRQGYREQYEKYVKRDKKQPVRMNEKVVINNVNIENLIAENARLKKAIKSLIG